MPAKKNAKRNKTSTTSISLAPEMHALWASAASRRGLTMADLIRAAVTSSLDRCPTCGKEVDE
jgi:hypothetical protein